MELDITKFRETEKKLQAYYGWSKLLQMKDDSKNALYIENLTKEYVTSYDDVTQILIKGLSNRKVGATSLNSKSSRSHIIFTFVIVSWCKEELIRAKPKVHSSDGNVTSGDEIEKEEVCYGEAMSKLCPEESEGSTTTLYASADDFACTANASWTIKSAFRDSFLVSSCTQSPILGEPQLPDSLKIKNVQRKSVAYSPSCL
ncbi:hypothetical protein JHK86_034299 [Glycine max]|nr:hypothetical protein JHK86_034299 [Glycine max]